MAAFDEGPIIGIDLGTTFSCVAVYDTDEKKVKVLPNAQGNIIDIKFFIMNLILILFIINLLSIKVN